MSKNNINGMLFIVALLSFHDSYGMKRQKGKVEPVANRRQSLSSALDPAKKVETEQPTEQPKEKHRTFSLSPQLKLKPRSKSLEVDASASRSDALGETQPAQAAVLLALSRKVAPVNGAPEVPAEQPVGSAGAVQQRMRVKVQIPKLTDLPETVYELKEVLVSPQKVEPALDINTAQRTLSRKASLLRVMYIKGRSGRDSQTDFTAKDYLGELGKGALFANPSPGQSPRSEDTITPRSDNIGTPRSDDGTTPRSEDAVSPRSDDTPSPRIDEEK